MKHKSFTFALFFLIFAIISHSIFAQTQTSQTNKNYQFINGNWFDGKTFKRKVFYSVGGVFSDKKPQKIDEMVDLKNGFVIPPFADAHTHNLNGVYGLESNINSYLKEGTFYVQVLGNHATNAKLTRPLLNKNSTLDVVYANAMLTCTYGHPFMVFEPLAMGIYDPAQAFKRIDEVKKSRRAENDAYVFLDSKQDVDQKWEKILATKPDLIKIGLLDAENYNKDAAANDMINKGLSPEVAAYVVAKAHQAKLRVFAHIETANDFRLGLKIGVDGFAHAPGYGWNGDEKTRSKYEIDDADIKLAAQKKVVVIPTARIGEFYAAGRDEITYSESKETRIEKKLTAQKNLLERMRRKGVTIALGSDNFSHFLGEEIEYFYKNKIFDNLTLLKIATETTPQTIFPNRKIGKLQNGFEASFIVLEENPLEDFSRTKNISFGFKQGEKITVK